MNLLLSSLEQTDTAVGEWLNIIGYVNESQEVKLASSNLESGERTIEVKIQAIMLWSATGIKLGEYESSVQNRAIVMSQFQD